MLSRSMTGNVHEIIKIYLLSNSKNNLTVLDATLGNGFDLAFLASLKNVQKIWGFDIQDEALQSSKEKVQDSDKEINLIKDCHSNIKKYVNDEIDLAIFNLGYLPSGDKNIVTKTETTIKAISETMDLLGEEGMLVVTAYPGHNEGQEEYEQLKKHFMKIPSKKFNILNLSMINVTKPCPSIFIIV